eukprot:123111_1
MSKCDIMLPTFFFICFISSCAIAAKPIASPTHNTTTVESYISIYANQFEDQQIICSGTRVCEIRCESASACRNTTITSASALTPKILLHCAATDACHYLHLSGSALIASISCNSYQTCAHAIFDVRDSSQVHVDCDGENACEYANVYCPKHSYPCTIYCVYDRSCYHMNVFIQNAKSNVWIQSYGYTNVDGLSLNCDDGTSTMLEIDSQYRHWYLSYPPGVPVNCSDCECAPQTICASDCTLNPTIDTFEPTLFPTIEPTTPTDHPTMIPSFLPTSQPTQSTIVSTLSTVSAPTTPSHTTTPSPTTPSPTSPAHDSTYKSSDTQEIMTHVPISVVIISITACIVMAICLCITCVKIKRRKQAEHIVSMSVVASKVQNMEQHAECIKCKEMKFETDSEFICMRRQNNNDERRESSSFSINKEGEPSEKKKVTTGDTGGRLVCKFPKPKTKGQWMY